jgi:heme/copper-type cytochrome/quinol oxidase subunit 2
VTIRHVPDADLAQTLTWIWLGVIAVVVLAYVVFRAWRKRHPSARRGPKMNYSKRLKQRLSKHPASKANHPDPP